jgi:hypothetical protein
MASAFIRSEARRVTVTCGQYSSGKGGKSMAVIRANVRQAQVGSNLSI